MLAKIKSPFGSGSNPFDEAAQAKVQKIVEETLASFGKR